MFGISWLWWLIGVLGIGGTIALAFIAPTVIPLVFRAIVGVFSYLLGRRWGCALLTALVLIPIVDIHRSRRDAAIWEERVADFNRQQDERDKRIATETRAVVEKELAATKKDEDRVDQQTVATIGEFKHVEPVPALGNPFRVGADSCRLREIVGQAGCGPQGRHERMPTPKRRPNRTGDH